MQKVVTFGVEVEYEKTSRRDVDIFVNENCDNWYSHGDGSLDSGGEISSPVLRDDKKTWQQLQKICEYLKSKNADTFHKAGGHIHIGAHILGNNLESWKQFLKTYAVYEHILFRFIYGDKLTARKLLRKYAPPISDSLFNYMNRISNAEDIDDIRICLNNFDRYGSINFNNVNFYNLKDNCGKNTIEFRSPNATVEEVVWQNNINVFAKLLVASGKTVIDMDFVNYKINYEWVSYEFKDYMYNMICLKNVLEFVDLIFDNNLDKVYFLRQYFKSFEEYYNLDYAVRSRKFVK